MVSLAGGQPLPCACPEAPAEELSGVLFLSAGVWAGRGSTERDLLPSPSGTVQMSGVASWRRAPTLSLPRLTFGGPSRCVAEVSLPVA